MLANSLTTTSTTNPTDSKAQASDKPVRKQAKLSSFFKKSDSVVEEKKEETILTQADDLQHSSSSSPSILATAQKISYDFEDIEQKFVGEGRTITIEFDKFILVVCYVPNSGNISPLYIDYIILPLFFLFDSFGFISILFLFRRGFGSFELSCQ